MEELKQGQIVTVQARSCKIGGLHLVQDETLEIERVTNSLIDFKRLSDGQIHTVSRLALTMVVAKDLKNK